MSDLKGKQSKANLFAANSLCMCVFTDMEVELKTLVR